jgi:mannose-6-phosphate isomerase-like protein (cupin superfamily)
MKPILLLLLLAGLAIPAGDPAGFHFWSSTELKTLGRKLGATATTAQPGSERLAAFGNYGFLAAYRKSTGEAEVHENQADIFVVQSGEATLAYGGKVTGAKTTAPGEIRGAGVQGGIEKKLAAGDIVTIPAKTPHQVKVAAGKEIYYFTVKMTQ